MTTENKYYTRHMTEWENTNADLIFADVPFGINFDEEGGNYNRDKGRCVDGYVEWGEEEYMSKVHTLLNVIDDNLTQNGQTLIFSGWNNSHVIHDTIKDHTGLKLEGKLYWTYNFATYCKKRPAHNVYEIFWAVKSDEWYYDNTCNYDHCRTGESNLCTISVKRDYKRDMRRYKNSLPLKLILILLDHFSREGDLVLDPLAGSGIVGIACAVKDRRWLLGDLNKKGKNVFKKLWSFYNEKGFNTLRGESKPLDEAFVK